MHVSAHLDVDLVAVESADTVHLLLDLTAPPAPTVDRAEQTVVVVLDRSGSMGGGRLSAAKRALLALVDRLDGRDRFGVVAFDNQAQVVVPAAQLADVDRAAVRRSIGAIGPGGMTDLSSGYLRGLQEAARVATGTGATVVLLSDGHANQGVTDAAALEGLARRAASQDLVTTSTIGIGTGYDESVLAALARGGSGNHSFAEHADAAGAALASEVEGLLSKTVQAASLHLRPGAAVRSVQMLNDLPVNQVPDGIIVELGDMYGAEQRKLVLQLDVPGIAALGLTTLAELVLTYVELPALTQHTVTLPLSVNVVPGDEAAGRVRRPDVEVERLLLTAQRSKREAEEALARGDVDAAELTLRASADDLWSAPTTSPEIEEERAWYAETLDTLRTRGQAYSSKRLLSDQMHKSRGYKSRTQGGEVVDPGDTAADTDGR